MRDSKPGSGFRMTHLLVTFYAYGNSLVRLALLQ